MRAQLGASTLRPERSADPLEDAERLLEGRSRLPTALGPTLRTPEREERARPVERQLDDGVPLERLTVGRQSLVQLARVGGEQAPAARGVRERGRTLEATRVALVPLEQLGRLLAPTELGETLDLIDDGTHESRLSNRLATQGLDERAEPGNRMLRIALSRAPGEPTRISPGMPHTHSRARVERARCSGILGFGAAAQLREHETLEGKVEAGQQRLTRLLRRVEPVSDSLERRLQPARDRVEGCQQEVEIGP